MSWLAIAGTIGGYILFLAVTAVIALRYITGAAEPRTAASMGVVVGAIGAGATTLGVHPTVVVAAALLGDLGVVKTVGAHPWLRSLGVVTIHMVVSVLVGTVGFGLLALAANAPV
jgi:hypothetical protein